MREKYFCIAPSFLLPLFLLCIQSPPADALLFFAAILLHEAGHLFTLLCYGCRVKGVAFSFSGISLNLHDPYIPYKKEAKIFLAGPMAGLIGCFFAWICLRWHFTRWGMLFFSFNLLLSLFNLLPIRGLDGGEALFALLCHYGEEEGAKRASDFIHRLALTFLLCAATWLFFFEKNCSLLLLTLLFAAKETKRKKATITS